MSLKRIGLTSLMVALVVASSACDNSGSDTTPTPTVVPVNEVLTGTVQIPVNGTLQSAFNTFVVGQGGGTVSVTLTSAVETLPGGTLLTTVTMGLGIGTVTNGTCTPFSNAFVTAQASSTPQLTGGLNAGSYCVQVSDVTSQVGPVAYALAVSHP
jgi:hypothetical protein